MIYLLLEDTNLALCSGVLVNVVLKFSVSKLSMIVLCYESFCLLMLRLAKFLIGKVWEKYFCRSNNMGKGKVGYFFQCPVKYICVVVFLHQNVQCQLSPLPLKTSRCELYVKRCLIHLPKQLHRGGISNGIKHPFAAPKNVCFLNTATFRFYYIY